MKKILCLLLLIPSICLGQDWDGVSAMYNWYNNPDGDSYYISTPEDLKGLSNIVNAQGMPYDSFEGKTIFLKNDINLNNQIWNPIGGTVGATLYDFKGIFDGKNHFISALKLESKDQQISYSGLFGCNSGTIKNLKLRGITSNFNLYPSSVLSLSVGFVVGVNKGIISNCDIVCSLYFTENATISTANTPMIGGVSGENYGTIEKSSFSGYIGNCINKAIIGGITGGNYVEALIQQCKSISNVKINSGEQLNSGGIAANSFGIIKDCIFTGSLQSNTTWSMMAGICFNGNAENCISIGEIIGNGTYNNLSAITSTTGGAINCYYVGAITNAQGEGNNISFQDLTNKDTFTNFSDDIWMLNNGDMPSLKSSVAQYSLNIKSGTQGIISIPMYANKETALTIKSENNWRIYSVSINGEITYVSSDIYIINCPAYSSDTDIEIIYTTTDTNIQEINNYKYNIHGEKNKIIITGLEQNENILVYTNNGNCIYKTNSSSNTCIIPLSISGIYIIKIGDFITKIAI